MRVLEITYSAKTKKYSIEQDSFSEDEDFREHVSEILEADLRESRDQKNVSEDQVLEVSQRVNNDDDSPGWWFLDSSGNKICRFWEISEDSNDPFDFELKDGGPSWMSNSQYSLEE